jgi:hypothetical protein
VPVFIARFINGTFLTLLLLDSLNGSHVHIVIAIFIERLSCVRSQYLIHYTALLLPYLLLDTLNGSHVPVVIA